MAFMFLPDQHDRVRKNLAYIEWHKFIPIGARFFRDNLHNPIYINFACTHIELNFKIFTDFVCLLFENERSLCFDSMGEFRVRRPEPTFTTEREKLRCGRNNKRSKK